MKIWWYYHWNGTHRTKVYVNLNFFPYRTELWKGTLSIVLEVVFLSPPRKEKTPEQMDFFFPKTLFFTTKTFFLQKNFLVVKNKVLGENSTLDPPPRFWGIPPPTRKASPHSLPRINNARRRCRNFCVKKKILPPDIRSNAWISFSKYYFHITFPPDDLFATSFFSILCTTFFFFSKKVTRNDPRSDLWGLGLQGRRLKKKSCFSMFSIFYLVSLTVWYGSAMD